MNIKKFFMIISAMCVLLFSGTHTWKAQAATPTFFEAYQKASYETKSPDFELRVSGQSVDVVQYLSEVSDFGQSKKNSLHQI